MPAKTTRKIIPMGEGAGVITLPADWRRYHGLTPGKNVGILYDSLLLVVPADAEHKLRKKQELIRRLLE